MRFDPLPDAVAVSYVMPVLNEEDYLVDAVRTILAQDHPGEKEIVLALGPSTDRTDAIAREIARSDPRVQLVSNPEGDIPIGLNLAIERTRFPIVIRVDAHSELTRDYTAAGIAALRETGAANVGGIMRARGRNRVQAAIARAYNSPVGLGGGTYHGDGVAGAAESAYLGIFRREALEAVGAYDPTIRRGEDWELNLRIRRAGGTVWFDPHLQVTYWPRSSFADLARQFFATGAWRAVLVRRYGRANPWRFFAPGTLVLLLGASVVIALLQVFGALPWVSAFSLLHIVSLGYGVSVITAGCALPQQRGINDRLLSIGALVTMHLSWGTGFLSGIVRGARRTRDRSRAR